MEGVSQKRKIASSRGSQYDFAEVKLRENKSASEADMMNPKKIKSKAPTEINKENFCQLLRAHICQKNNLNCIRSFYTSGLNTDDEAAVSVLMSCRSRTFNMIESEKQLSMQHMFLDCIESTTIVHKRKKEDSGDPEGGKGYIRYNMDYSLPQCDPNCKEKEIPVCRECFAFAYDFKVTDIKKFSDLTKNMDNPHTVLNLNSRKITDATIPQGTYNAIEDVFYRNLDEYAPDPMWIKAAKMPLADAQQMALVWLIDFFDTNAEVSPTDDCLKIHVTYKTEVYTSYKTSLERCDCPSESDRPKPISEQRFMELWNCVFPRVYTQSACDIPGKCDLCADIDIGMRQAETKIEAQAFKDAHILHRGGFFMPQRHQ